ncbi:MAG: helix-turn-helix domain-containing protein [Bacillota bacterium]|nr:MAG: helix-turn-helix domain-containing protein [Bacillota bacterium]
MRVGIVDAEEIERTAVKWILKHSVPAAKVVFESDGAQQLLEGIGLALDVLLVDPQHARGQGAVTGYPLVARLKQELPETALVVASYSKSAVHVVQALRSGASDYLFKPVSRDELLESLGRLAGKRSEEPGKALGGDGPARGRDQSDPDLRTHAQNEFLYQLLFGNVDSLKEIWRRSKLVGLDELPNVVMVVSIDDFVLLGSDRSEAWKRSLRREVLDLVYEALSGVAPSPHVFVVAEDRAAILLRVRDEADPKTKDFLLDLADKVRRAVADSLSLTVSVGVGSPGQDPTDLHVSFREAQRALGRKFFLGENLVVHADEVPAMGKGLPFLSGSDWVPSLIAKVRIKDREGALRVLDRILDELLAAAKSAEAVRLAATEVILMVVRVAFETGAYSGEFLNHSAEWAQDALRSGGAGELRQIMTRAIGHIVDSLDATVDSRHLTLLRRAVDYINENYARELTLKEVARTVWLSPSYLSHLFSKEVGYSFVEYVTKVRIERARVLLVGTSLSISEVAAEVGYKDASYFSRVFKTATGQAPTQYRMQALKAV